MSGRLYIVSTPIGNLGDITARALETPRTADVIAAEDTRRTAALLSAYDIHGSLISFHEHSSRAKAEELLRRLLSGESIAIVTDAGTPIISDPGEVLTKLAADNGIEIVSVPGACAAISALPFHIPGLPAQRQNAQREDKRGRSLRADLRALRKSASSLPHSL